MRRPLGLPALLVLTATAAWLPAPAAAGDPPELAGRIARGELPPLRQRLPEHPLVVQTDPEATYGGDLPTLIESRRSCRITGSLVVRLGYVYRRRVFSGEAAMSVGISGEFGLPTPDMSPAWLAPVSEEQLQWSRWGLYFESNGKRGEAPDLPAVRRLVELYRRWLVSLDRSERERIWAEMLDINADEVFTIGILGGTLQPVVVANGLRGVPERGIYAWDPGAQLGVYGPDTFYWHSRRR